MKLAIKEEIIQATHQYMADKGLVPNSLSKASGVNAAYLHNMLKGETMMKKTPIGDKYYRQLAEFIGYKITREFIGVEQTWEFKKLIYKLEQAKFHQRHFVFLAETGRGKTFTCNVFKKKHPKHTYIITANTLASVRDIINELVLALDISVTENGSYIRLRMVIQKLRELKQRGCDPIVIFDESENFNLRTFQMIKGLYDGIKDVAGIAVLGTPQFKLLMQGLERRNKQGMPQFASRFVGNMVEMPTTINGLTQIVDKYVVDPELKRLLMETCPDYRQLTDRLTIAMQYAEEQDKPLTVELYKLVHDIDSE